MNTTQSRTSSIFPVRYRDHHVPEFEVEKEGEGVRISKRHLNYPVVCAMAVRTGSPFGLFPKTVHGTGITGRNRKTGTNPG